MPDTPHHAPFERARALFEQGLQALQAGQPEAAQQHLQACLELMPGRVSPLVALGAVRLQLGQVEPALKALNEALAQDSTRADAWGHRADALLRLDRPAEALAALDHTDPNEPASGWHRALALSALGRHDQALATLDRLRAQDPEHAPLWLETGRTLQCLGRHAEAGPAYQHAVQLQPDFGQAWSLLGQWHQDQGQTTEARQALAQALAHGHDPELNAWFLAGAQAGAAAGPGGAQATPDTAPAHYVAALFDGYAPQFDHHLVQVLGYNTPQRMLELLGAQPAAAPAPRAALDLGCGTGLCGPGLQQWVGPGGHVDGVDLSSGMLEKAKVLQVYRELHTAEAGAFLHGTPQRYDVVLASDVFVYVGALHGIFAGVRRVLRSGGRFVFSVEEIQPGEETETQDTAPAGTGVMAPANGERSGKRAGVLLRSTMRYAHSERYVRDQAQQAGFVLLGLQRSTLRHHQGQPVVGLCVLLELK